MIWTVSEMQLIDSEGVKKHAAGKAREDLNQIFTQCGISEIQLDAPQQERKEADPVRKLLYHFTIFREWEKIADRVDPGDTLILQFPPINHTLLLPTVLKKMTGKGIKLVVFIHDLDLLRRFRSEETSRSEKWRLKREELDDLKLFDKIIVHNERMKSFLSSELGIRENAMQSLGLFDYLMNEGFQPADETDPHNGCIIAGNLVRGKSAFIYQLPDKPDFELYGINYEGTSQDNIHYHGSFLPEDLPNHLKGSFGLVWDGDSTDTCSGAWGAYLRYNNPHKTSLYLACGIPVITWNEAAIADFILEHNVGITVANLGELEQAIRAITPEQYHVMKMNARMISEKLRNGYYTRKALDFCTDMDSKG